MNIFTVAGSTVSKNVALLTLAAILVGLLPASVWAEETSPEPQIAEEVIQVVAEEVPAAPVENDEVQTEEVVVVEEEEVVEENIDTPTESLSKASEFLAAEDPEVINTCLIPDVLGDESAFVLQASGEKTIGQMLADHGYSAVDTTADQMNYQVWNLTDTSADSVTFSMRVLGKRAGNTQIVGYYKAGDTLTFTEVLTQTLDTDGESSVSVTIPAAFANSFGFALKSADKTWFSEISLNSDDEDHVAAYNPSSNLYLLAFEDFENLGDGDYNDIVIEISAVTCNKAEEYTISGYKFNDKNGNGSWDKETEEPLSNWEIILESGDEETLYARTDESGYYSFTVLKGSYRVSETQQKGWEQTATIGTNADGPSCYIEPGLESSEESSEEVQITEGYTCTFGNQETSKVINTCFVPDSLSDEGNIVLQNSGEKSVATMLAEHGYAGVDVVTDQKNYQVWNLTDVTTDEVTFSMRVLGKNAGNTQVVGYYKAGNALTFTPVLTQALDTNGESAVSVTVPAAFASSFGFALQSADKTWFTEKALNSDGLDHIVAFNPSANLYLLAFEDFNNLGDSDYNDIVIEISAVTCKKGNGDGGNNGDDEEVVVTEGGRSGGTRISRAPRGEVLGASTATPAGLVLGEATSTLPVGAPNTGAGGAAPITVTLPTLVAILPTPARRVK